MQTCSADLEERATGHVEYSRPVFCFLLVDGMEATHIYTGWLGSRVVSVLDSGAVGPAARVQIAVATLSGNSLIGKLLTPIVLLLTKQRNW